MSALKDYDIEQLNKEATAQYNSIKICAIAESMKILSDVLNIFTARGLISKAIGDEFQKIFDNKSKEINELADSFEDIDTKGN